MKKLTALCFFLTVAITPALAAAQDSTSSNSDSSAPTRIETDTESHEIRFYVDGELAAVLKQDGLHVRDDINFGGVVSDYGRSGFDERAGWKEYKRQQAEGRDAP